MKVIHIVALFYCPLSEMGSPDLIKFMIERGVDVNVTSSKGGNCLGYCHVSSLFYEKDDILEKIELLIDAGIDLENPSSQKMLMEFISAPTKTMTSEQKVRITEATKLLIKKGVHLDFQDEEGWTALHCAVWFNNIEVLRLLLEAGADPDIEQRKGEKPIDFARKLKRQEMVKLLKEAKKS
jgi:ankyrin repeat protein